MTRQELKIVSGGQTGVDQGALTAALDLGLVWGGWVPKGWRAENGTVPEQFRARMQEHASANYIVRTRQNVADSHATLILTDAYPLSGGTLRTRDFCMNSFFPSFEETLRCRIGSKKIQYACTWQIGTVPQTAGGADTHVFLV